jgi:hypothetical protein
MATTTITDLRTERRYLFDRGDNYLFSYDVKLAMAGSGVGWNLAFPRPADSRGQLAPVGGGAAPYTVFDVNGETSGDGRNGRAALWGHVCWAKESLRFESSGDAAVGSGSMTLRGREGALIDARFYGVHRLEELGHRRLEASGPLRPPVELTSRLWIRFDTTHTKYVWLTQVACLGFGRGAIGEYGADVTFDLQMDVYALS